MARGEQGGRERRARGALRGALRGPTAVNANLAAAFAVSILALSAVQAAEVCVHCFEPDARYRCDVDGGGAPGAGADPRLQMMCITELAKAGRHATCAVERNASGACQGEQRLVTLPPLPVEGHGGIPPGPVGGASVGREAVAAQPGTGSAHPAGALPPPGAAGGAVGAAPAPADPAGERPPATVEELARDTARSSQKGLEVAGRKVAETAKDAGAAAVDTAKTAGGAIGTAAKRSWDCLVSLFKGC